MRVEVQRLGRRPESARRWDYGHRPWRRLRRLVVVRAGGCCESCGSPDNLVLHHRHYDTYRAERLQDVELLCGLCHARRHRVYVVVGL